MGLIVVEQLQAYLIGEGVGQAPGADPSTVLPAIYLQPRQGAPAPRKPKGGGNYLENAVITLHDTQLTGPPGIAAWLEDCFINITIRALNAGEGKLLHRTIAGLLAPIGKIGGRKHWTMNELLVQESRIFRREQALPAVDNGVTYDRVAQYQFRCARSDLAA